MSDKILMKGNEAIAEAAIVAGCTHFFGYPITPQNEIPEYMARRMPQIGGCFLQAESEISAINMVYGAAGVGARVMTSSSSPGISLKQEGISYIAGAQLPCVIVNMVRGGPGLGGIQPAQSDYFQSVKGGGHGDYRLIVLAPSSIQEACTLTQYAFDMADHYRNPVLVLGDGMLGQMMEPASMQKEQPLYPAADKSEWAAQGWDGKSRKRAIINSLVIDPLKLEKHNEMLQAKYVAMQKEVRFEEVNTEDAEIIVAAYGTMARIVLGAVRRLRAKGAKVGLIRPITLWPFPTEVFAKAAEKSCVKRFLSVEMSAGQMVEDVRLAVAGRKPVSFYGRTGGSIPTIEQVEAALMAELEG